MMIWPAFKNDPFNAVTFLLSGPHNPSIERCLFRQIAQGMKHEGFERLLPRGDLLGSLDGRDCPPPLAEVSEGLVLEVLLERGRARYCSRNRHRLSGEPRTQDSHQEQ